MKLEISDPATARLKLLGVQIFEHGDGIVVRRGSKRVFLQGQHVKAAISLVAQCMIGGSDIEGLMCATPPHLRTTVEQLLDALRDRRMIVKLEETADAAPEARAEEVFWWTYGAEYHVIREKFSRLAIDIVGANLIGETMFASLRRSGFGQVSLIDHALLRNVAAHERLAVTMGSPLKDYDEWAAKDVIGDMLVVCSDFGGLELMRDWNRFCVTYEIPFLSVVLQDEVGYIGPAVIPRQTPCFECFWRRQNSNLDDVAATRAAERDAFSGQHAVGYAPQAPSIIGEIAAFELVKYHSQALPNGNIGSVIEFDTSLPSLRTRKVLKAPRCPVCSGLSTRPLPAADRTVFMPGND